MCILLCVCVCGGGGGGGWKKEGKENYFRLRPGHLNYNAISEICSQCGQG